MVTDVGEYIVGAYLHLKLKCDFVNYNVSTPGGGLRGLGEIDVLGFDLKHKSCYLCEVTTHIRGVLYRDNYETVRRIRYKYNRQKHYAKYYLRQFKNRHFMFWSPIVPRGYITDPLEKITGLELIINGEYKQRVEELSELAARITHDTHNPFFRILQILRHLRN